MASTTKPNLTTPRPVQPWWRKWTDFQQPYVWQIVRMVFFPTVVLVIAGVCLLIGLYNPNPNNLEQNNALANVTQLFHQLGVFLLTQGLGVVLAGSIVAGLNLTEGGVAVLATIVGYVVYAGTIAGIMTGYKQVPHSVFAPHSGIKTAESYEVFKMYSGLFGYEIGYLTISIPIVSGIIIALTTVIIHRFVRTIKLPQVLGFFQGTRFVAIVVIVISSLLGVLSFYIFYDFVLPDTFREYVGGQ